MVERITSTGFPPDPAVADILANRRELRFRLLGRLGREAFADGVDDGKPVPRGGECRADLGGIAKDNNLHSGVGDSLPAGQFGEQAGGIALQADAGAAGGPEQDDADATRRFGSSRGRFSGKRIGNGHFGAVCRGRLIET